MWGHSSKNAGGMLCSALRTIFYGDLWCDPTAARAVGLPPGALGRDNPMSDALQALLMNPYYYVDEVASRLETAAVFNHVDHCRSKYVSVWVDQCLLLRSNAPSLVQPFCREKNEKNIEKNRKDPKHFQILYLSGLLLERNEGTMGPPWSHGAQPDGCDEHRAFVAWWPDAGGALPTGGGQLLLSGPGPDSFWPEGFKDGRGHRNLLHGQAVNAESAGLCNCRHDHDSDETGGHWSFKGLEWVGYGWMASQNDVLYIILYVIVCDCIYVNDCEWLLPLTGLWWVASRVRKMQRASNRTILWAASAAKPHGAAERQRLLAGLCQTTSPPWKGIEPSETRAKGCGEAADGQPAPCPNLRSWIHFKNIGGPFHFVLQVWHWNLPRKNHLNYWWASPFCSARMLRACIKREVVWVGMRWLCIRSRFWCMYVMCFQLSSYVCAFLCELSTLQVPDLLPPGLWSSAEASCVCVQQARFRTGQHVPREHRGWCFRARWLLCASDRWGARAGWRGGRLVCQWWPCRPAAAAASQQPCIRTHWASTAVNCWRGPRQRCAASGWWWQRWTQTASWCTGSMQLAGATGRSKGAVSVRARKKSQTWQGRRFPSLYLDWSSIPWRRHDESIISSCGEASLCSWGCRYGLSQKRPKFSACIKDSQLASVPRCRIGCSGNQPFCRAIAGIESNRIGATWSNHSVEEPQCRCRTSCW